MGESSGRGKRAAQVLRLTTAAAAVMLAAGTAHAHIVVTGDHVSRWNEMFDTKVGPCGTPKGPARQNVYTYQAGETITVEINEFIAHPGYFRIAFDDDGDDDFLDPRWIVPQDPEGRLGGCPRNDVDQCRPEGEGDFFNNDTVLMDNLNPHLAAETEGTWSWEVTLPDIACDNCTLQIIQVMEDPLGHGDYNTSPELGENNDVYHQCIDLILEGPIGGDGAGDGTMTPATDAGTPMDAPDGGVEPVPADEPVPTTTTDGQPDQGTATGSDTGGAGSAPTATTPQPGAAPGETATQGGDSSSSGCTVRAAGRGGDAATLVAPLLGVLLWLRRRRTT
jgi:hypothetical protein